MTGPVFCLLLGVSSDCAQPITGQVTKVTCPVIGWAQPELTLSKRQKTGPGHASVTGCFFFSTNHWQPSCYDAKCAVTVRDNPRCHATTSAAIFEDQLSLRRLSFHRLNFTYAREEVISFGTETFENPKCRPKVIDELGRQISILNVNPPMNIPSSL